MTLTNEQLDQWVHVVKLGKCWHDVYLDAEGYYNCKHCDIEKLGQGPWGMGCPITNPNYTSDENHRSMILDAIDGEDKTYEIMRKLSEPEQYDTFESYKLMFHATLAEIIQAWHQVCEGG
jgi:hypothetical protein